MPDLTRERRKNLVGQGTSLSKLNGQVYTPLPVASRMLDRVAWPSRPGDLLDPSCGDGIFLEAALRKLAGAGLGPQEARFAIERMEGWDIDAEALEQARSRLGRVSVELGLGGAIPRLLHRDALQGAQMSLGGTPEPGPPSPRFACIVGNPPYLEAKRMPDALKSRVKACCPVAAQGAFDLYAAFLERADQLLASEGEICFLVPNRFLVLQSMEDLRLRFLARYQVDVEDLSTDRVFEGAAVYPIVVHARRSVDPGYGFRDGIPTRVLVKRLGGRLPVLPPDREGRRFLARILGSRFPALRDVARTRWCVSFHKAGLRDRYTFDSRPDTPFARKFLGGGRFQGNREVEPGRIVWGEWWIDYDEERARNDGNPLPSPSLFEGPKIVLCQNARRARAAIDRDNHVLKDTFLAIRVIDRTNTDAWLSWILLVLHSNLFHYLYEHLYGGTRKGGGFLHFLPGYLDPFPIAPLPDPVRCVELAARVGRDDAFEEIEAFVRAAYKVQGEEERALEAYDFPA